MHDDLISVILPVFNGERTIQRAVQSILSQTYRNLELIVINDGSTDGTAQILASFEDPRIKVLDQENRGLVGALNRGIGESQGEYIARMDADDVALPERLARQVTFLQDHPRVGVVGSAVKVIYENGVERIRLRPQDTASISKNILRICPFCHSSVMIRREVFERVGLYDARKDGSKQLLVEDYDLWVRILAFGYDLANLPEVLMLYYKEPDSILRSRSATRRIKQQILSRVDAIQKLRLGYFHYLNILPVVVLSLLNHYGLRLDGMFNLLSSRHTRRISRMGFGPGGLEG